MTVINGESFGKYKILSEIGKGGMGEVYLAQEEWHIDRFELASPTGTNEPASPPSDSSLGNIGKLRLVPSGRLNKILESVVLTGLCCCFSEHPRHK